MTRGRGAEIEVLSMKTVHVVPSIANEASGPSYSVPSLCRALASAGAAVELHVLAPAPASGSEGFEVHAHAWWPIIRKLGISPAMKRALRAAAERSEIMHSHSLWMMPNVYPARAVRGTDCRLVVSPRGTLSPWALRHHRWRKRVMWFLHQRRAIVAAALLHATSASEHDDMRGKGLRAPVAVLPNGIDLPELPASKAGPSGRRRLLYLGRIHPIKGIDDLLRAWRNVQASFEGWELHITGPGNEVYVGQMKALAAELGAERVTFTGPAYGAEKSAAYADADLYVLPTHSENFGMTVAEALAHATPAIVTRGAPWDGLETNDCGWWIDIGEAPLTECLRNALAASPEELRARGLRGREWMERDFSWGRIGSMMLETYEWLLGGGAPPEWVQG